MKKGNGLWFGILFFIAGSLFCYFALQWHLLIINLEVHIPELLATIAAAIVGLYIADSIQKKLTRNQNKYLYISNKLDVLWSLFNQYADNFNYSANIELEKVNHFHKQANVSISFLKNIFIAYNLQTDRLDALDNLLETIQYNLESVLITDNILYLDETQLINIRNQLNNINLCFSDILRQIHNN